MAIYDRDATPASAVTAWLAQYKVAASGAITFVSGTDTFHVYWIHRALQKIAWDFNISGDDELNLSKPNPSTSEALGTIITLLDHTTDYSVNYTITATVMEQHFGGSVTYENGDEQYGGLSVLGTVNLGTTELEIIQDNLLITSHWGTGKNQTDSSTLLRICIKTRTAGADIDGQRVIVKSNEWFDTYAVWRTTMGLGEKVAAINTSNDPQNNTALATVQGYTGIVENPGYQLLDVQADGNPQPFYSKWDYGGNDNTKLYEHIKSLMVRGSSDTIFGLDGSFFVGGPTFSVPVDTSGGGTWVVNEIVTWTEGAVASSGVMLAADALNDSTTAELWVQILKGVNPTDGTVISGATASNAVNGAATAYTPAPNHTGVWTGTAWIGGYGVGFVPGNLGTNDRVTDLDGDILAPPNNVTIVVNTNGAVDPHVFLARKDGVLEAPDYTMNTVGAGNTSGNGTFVVATPIDSETPPDGFVLVLDTNGGATTYEPLEYTSWTGSTYTLAGTLPRTYTAGDPVFTPLLYESAVGGSDPRTAASSLIYAGTPFDVIGWVRHGDPASPDKPVPLSGQVTAAGFSVTVQLDNET